MIAITTKSSINVNAFFRILTLFSGMLPDYRKAAFMKPANSLNRYNSIIQVPILKSKKIFQNN